MYAVYPVGTNTSAFSQATSVTQNPNKRQCQLGKTFPKYLFSILTIVKKKKKIQNKNKKNNIIPQIQFKGKLIEHAFDTNSILI